MASSGCKKGGRKRTATTRFDDEEYSLVQFIEDGLRRVVQQKHINANGTPGNITAKFDDGSHYKCIILETSDDKENLLRKKSLLESTGGKRGKKQATGGTKKVKLGEDNNEDNTDEMMGEENEDIRQIVAEEEVKKKQEKNKEKKKKQQEAREKKRQEEEEKKKKKQKQDEERERQKNVLAGRAQSFLERMSSSSEDHFDVDIIQSASDIISSPQTSPDPPTLTDSPPALLIELTNDTPLATKPTAYNPPRPPVRQQLFTTPPITSPPPQVSLSSSNNLQPAPRPTVGGKCPRRQKSQCQTCIQLQQENEELRRRLEELVQRKTSERPRPGKVHPLLADRFKMVELTPGSGIYLFQDQVNEAPRRKSATACAAYLLNVFYTNSELVGRNLSGANGKQSVDEDIVTSIISYTTKSFSNTTGAAIKISLRNKLTALKNTSSKPATN